MLRFIFLIPVIAAGILSSCVPANQRISQINLIDLDDRIVNLTEINQHKATAIIFLSPECPLCQSYTLTINNLIKNYQNKSIDFIGVVPGSDFTVESINDYCTSYKAGIKILRDTNNTLVKLLHATITPEVFLIDNNSTVIYSGQIDNWAYSLGKKRTLITDNSLKDAIEETLSNKPITIPKTQAVGCFIE